MLSSNAQKIFEMKYQRGDESWEQACWRVASYIASTEPEDVKEQYTKDFYQLMSNLVMLPGGRVIANSGTNIKNLANCVSGNTKIQTESGLELAKNLAGKTTMVLSQGGVFRSAIWSNYGKQILYEITIENGDKLYATKEHEWIVSKSKGGYERVTTDRLVGRRIPLQHLDNFIYNETEYIEGVKNGLVFGDGNLYSDGKYSKLVQFGDSKEIIPRFFEKYSENLYGNGDDRCYVVSKLSPEYKSIPTILRSKSYIRGFIAGIIGSDGCVDSRGHVMFHNKNLDVIIQIRELCSYVNIPTTSIALVRKINPFNNEPSTLYKLTFVKRAMLDEKLIIMEKHRKKLFSSPITSKQQTLLVNDVKNTEIEEDVFCCIEPETHTMVIENGYLTGQCFVLPLDDSRQSIYTTLSDSAEIFAHGGGIGYSLGNIREEGSSVDGTGGAASGPLSFASLFDQTGEVISQASRR